MSVPPKKNLQTLYFQPLYSTIIPFLNSRWKALGLSYSFFSFQFSSSLDLFSCFFIDYSLKKDIDWNRFLLKKETRFPFLLDVAFLLEENNRAQKNPLLEDIYHYAEADMFLPMAFDPFCFYMCEFKEVQNPKNAFLSQKILKEYALILKKVPAFKIFSFQFSFWASLYDQEKKSLQEEYQSFSNIHFQSGYF